MKTDEKTTQRLYKMTFATVYPLYVAKVERKKRTKDEVNEIIRWLTGYSQKDIESHLNDQTDFETFFAKAPPSKSISKTNNRCYLWSSRRGY